MATFNYILGPKKNDGQYPIYLKICNGKTNTMRSTIMARCTPSTLVAR